MNHKEIETLGDGVPYLDGAEDELFEIMRKAEDRSVGSDELASKIRDWPTEYHLTRSRANLLKPFKLPPNTKVLDVGCGTGALTRQFAEWGNQVVGLEGSYARCKVANERVREFENAKIISGNLDEYFLKYPDNRFDFIMLCGVLEYSGAEIGGSNGPEKMLEQLLSLLNPNGILAIAIENKLGLKYLAGFNEDHLSKPIISTQNYLTEKTGIRTWSKFELGKLISDSGFQHTKWFTPYPDYKTPTVVVSEDIFGLPQGKQLVKNFVRSPIRDNASQPAFDMDPLTFWQQFQDIDSPENISNSFLVTCSLQELATTNFLDDGLLWIGNESRLKRFDNSKKLTLDADKLILESTSISKDCTNDELVFKPTVSEVIVGPNLEDWMVENLRNLEFEETTEIFRFWWLLAIQEINKYSGQSNFDISPKNFVQDEFGEWQFIDYEFYWNRKISDEIIFLRSFYALLAERLLPLRLPMFRFEHKLSDLARLISKGLGLSILDSDFQLAAEFTSKIALLAHNASEEEIRSNFQLFYANTVEKYYENKFTLLTRFDREKLIVDQKIALEKINFLESHIDDLNQQKIKILNSLSWKITKPIRILRSPTKYLKK